MVDALNQKTYVAADGQVLQSSLVKEGSPRKRQLTGSTSQVRFSLPASPSDDELSFSFNDEVVDADDSFDEKSIFNLSTKEVMSPTKATKRQSCIRNSIIELVQSSPDRKKLYIRPNTNLNFTDLPIPVEIMIPPSLSPENKAKSRPSSLIFNGVSYEPFINVALPTPTSEVIIPDVNTNILFSSPSKNPITDNEDVIRNPSDAAKKQDNQLNRTFSFPPRTQSKELPPLPTKRHIPTHQRSHTSLSGLQIYSPDGQIQSIETHSPFKKFGSETPKEMIVETEQDAESVYSMLSDEGNDTSQLLELRNSIISHSNVMNLESADSIVSEDDGINHTTDDQILQLTDLGNVILASAESDALVDANTHSTIVEDFNVSPLGSQLNPPMASASDQTEAEQYRFYAREFRNNAKESPLISQSSHESEISEPFSTVSSALTAASSVSSPLESNVIDLTDERYDLATNKTNNHDKYRSIIEQMNDDSLHEVIILDEEESTNHRTSKRNASGFSFETIASEVQLNHVEGRKIVNENQRRTYTANNKSIVELCDETIQHTRDVMDHLKRQKTLLMNQQIELLKQKKQQELNLIKIKSQQNNLKTSKGQSENYFDYANGDSYNFQTFMGTSL